MEDWERILWDGVRLRDEEGEEFLLLKIDWRLMSPESNARSVYDHYAKAFHFPFVLITQSPGTPAAFRVYGPDRLKTILARLDISSLRWERIEEL